MAPNVTRSAANDLTVNEGTTHTYTCSVTDPGVDTFSVVSTDCGLNGSQVGLTSTTLSGGSFDCLFPDGPASSTVSVQVKDSDNANSNTASQAVSVLNVAPSVTPSAATDLTVTEGTTHTYTLRVTDPGLDTFSVANPDCDTKTATANMD